MSNTQQTLVEMYPPMFREGYRVASDHALFDFSLDDLKDYVEEPMSDGDDGTGPPPTGDEEDNLDEEEDGKGDGDPVLPEKE